jgi:hypothetical protein
VESAIELFGSGGSAATLIHPAPSAPALQLQWTI